MRFQHVLVIGAAALAIPGCKKKGDGGGGGGGGGWFVGERGLMTNVDEHGVLGAGYDLGASEALYGIACRYKGEAWVVGAHGTLLYTSDGGRSWFAQTTPLAGDLHAIATQDFGPVFVGGTDGMVLTRDGGLTWDRIGDGDFRSIAAAHEAPEALALAADGGLWKWDGAQLVQTIRIPAAHAVAISEDGERAIVAGAGLMLSNDGGASWRALDVDPSVVFEDVRLTEDGGAVAVGSAGAIATVDAEDHVSLQHVGTANLHTLHIADDDAIDTTGYAAGDNGQTFVTRDFGATWQPGPTLGATVWGVDEIGETHR